MPYNKFIITFLCSVLSLVSIAQVTGPEQDCINSILVCQETYLQNQYYLGNGNVNDIGNGTACFDNSDEENSVWYRVEVQSNGQLSFDIASLSGDDYDFAVYNVTDLTCPDIYNGTGLVRCSYTRHTDTTGLRPGYTDTTGSAVPNPTSNAFLKPIDVQAGETYLVLIEFYGSVIPPKPIPDGGYSLDFRQSTADIIDDTPAVIEQVEVVEVCAKIDTIHLYLDSEILCSSVAQDASDFVLSGPVNIPIQAALPLICDNWAETTEILLIPSDTLLSPGVYNLTLQQGSDGNTLIDGCGNESLIQTESFQVIAELPVPDFESPDEVCQNEEFQLEYTGTGQVKSVQWVFESDTFNNELQDISAVSTGNFDITLIYTDSICGVFTLSKEILVKPMPYFDLGNDTLICLQDQLALTAYRGADRIQWSSGETSEEIVIDSFNLYISARATLNNCSYTDSIFVGVRDEGCFKIIMPSAFSPNEDGLNDFYKVLSKKLESFTLRIYNRWGELVFEEENNRFGGWDGTYKGQDVEVGVYTYYVKGNTLLGDKIDQVGNFTLLR